MTSRPSLLRETISGSQLMSEGFSCYLSELRPHLILFPVHRTNCLCHMAGGETPLRQREIGAPFRSISCDHKHYDRPFRPTSKTKGA